MGIEWELKKRRARKEFDEYYGPYAAMVWYELHVRRLA